MKYTEGIIKIFDGNVIGAGSTLDEVSLKVKLSGYDAFSFNGFIYIHDREGDAIRTPFHLSDFEVE